MTKEERVREILTDLERTRENLLGLSDDIWLSIDHNDPDTLEAGVLFKRQYNEKMLGFDRLANELSQLVQAYTCVAIEPPVYQEAPKSPNKTQEDQRNERVIRELNHKEPHRLEEDFTFKRPYGFILLGHGYEDVVTWRRVYELFCWQLAELDPARFQQLPDHPELISKRGKPSFSRDPNALRVAMPLSGGIHAEANLSANHLRDQMRTLLGIFNLAEREIALFLRQDRDAAE